jgi:hypothetical protein
MYHSKIRPAHRIHHSWCGCRDCQAVDRRLEARRDLLITAVALGAALVAGAVVWVAQALWAVGGAH